MTRLTDNAPQVRPERLEGPITDGRFRVFFALNGRHALAVAGSGTRGDQLAIALADSRGHLFDLDPKSFARDRVQELHDALGEWLERTA